MSSTTESPDPDKEGLCIVRRDEPEPRLLNSAVTEAVQAQEIAMPEPDLPDQLTFFTLGRISVIVAIVVFVGSIIGSRYLIQQLHRAAGMPRTPAPSTDAIAASNPVMPVTADMLHVT